GPDGALINSLEEALKRQFIIDEQTMRNEIARQGIFQALDDESMIKVDFHVGEKIPHAFERSREVELLPSLRIPLISKEEAILSKLVWIQKGSMRSREDIISILKRKGEIDFAYLADQAQELHVNELWEELLTNTQT